MRKGPHRTNPMRAPLDEGEAQSLLKLTAPSMGGGLSGTVDGLGTPLNVNLAFSTESVLSGSKPSEIGRAHV